MDTAIWKHCISEMYAASRDTLCRPLPPTPTQSMCPPGCFSTGQIRETCSTQYRNMAKFIWLLLVALWSERYSSIRLMRPATSWTSSYFSLCFSSARSTFSGDM